VICGVTSEAMQPLDGCQIVFAFLS